MRVGLGLLALLMLNGPVRSEGTSGRVRVQLGQEVDTNVARTYSAGVSDGLLRIVIMGQLKLDL